MRNPRLPHTIDRFIVSDDGVLSVEGMSCFTWFNEEGYLGGTVRYTLVAEEVPQEELFVKTDSGKSCPCCGGKTELAAPKGEIPDSANYFCRNCWSGNQVTTQETQ